MQFQIPTFGAAVFLTVLSMGAFGVLVLVPIACIQFSWNSVSASVPIVPIINAWQATLLYLVLATLIYLGGIIRIEFDTEEVE